jgi:hypothetical protein
MHLRDAVAFPAYGERPRLIEILDVVVIKEVGELAFAGVHERDIRGLGRRGVNLGQAAGRTVTSAAALDSLLRLFFFGQVRPVFLGLDDSGNARDGLLGGLMTMALASATTPT